MMLNLWNVAAEAQAQDSTTSPRFLHFGVTQTITARNPAAGNRTGGSEDRGGAARWPITVDAGKDPTTSFMQPGEQLKAGNSILILSHYTTR